MPGRSNSTTNIWKNHFVVSKQKEKGKRLQELCEYQRECVGAVNNKNSRMQIYATCRFSKARFRYWMDVVTNAIYVKFAWVYLSITQTQWQTSEEFQKQACKFWFPCGGLEKQQNLHDPNLSLLVIHVFTDLWKLEELELIWQLIPGFDFIISKAWNSNSSAFKLIPCYYHT